MTSLHESVCMKSSKSLHSPILIDTHCHINMMVKSTFDVLLNPEEVTAAHTIVQEAADQDIKILINVGTAPIENQNCITLAQTNKNLWATIGIHPNDLQDSWKQDIHNFENILKNKKNLKIIGIGEVGLDYHYPNYDKKRQTAAFIMQIECALAHDLPLIIHTRDAQDDVLTILKNYQCPQLRGIIHCFSEDMAFAQKALELEFVLGIGGPLTYPKNNALREIFTTIPLNKIVLETDAPFLPLQEMRGRQNHPRHIKAIAQYLANLRGISFEEIATTTTQTALNLFRLYGQN